jgi:hypothetical protein
VAGKIRILATDEHRKTNKTRVLSVFIGVHRWPIPFLLSSEATDAHRYAPIKQAAEPCRLAGTAIFPGRSENFKYFG